MALPLFDVHAHYQDSRYDEDREVLLEEMRAAGVKGIIDSGDSAESSVKCIQCAEKHDFVYAAAGIHPLNILDTTQEDIDRVRDMLNHSKVVAVGEIGLDYYYEDCAPADIQKKWCKKLIELAAESRLPIVFHDREAHEDSLNMLKYAAGMGVTGLMHCYSGSVEMMHEIIKLGFSISVGGVVTFKNAKKIVEVVKEVPIEKLFLETDAPYLTPVPFRGERNNSAMIAYVAEKISEIKGLNTEEMCNIIYNNSIKMFGQKRKIQEI